MTIKWSGVLFWLGVAIIADAIAGVLAAFGVLVVAVAITASAFGQ